MPHTLAKCEARPAVQGLKDNASPQIQHTAIHTLLFQGTGGCRSFLNMCGHSRRCRIAKDTEEMLVGGCGMPARAGKLGFMLLLPLCHQTPRDSP